MATTITAGNATNGGAAVSADNTGILELKTGTGSGTTAMTVNASQNVGIGISSPLQRFNAVNTAITGGAPASSGSAADPNAVARFQAGSVALDVGAYAAGQMWLQPRAFTNYAINYDLVLQPNGGNVGIGTSSPSSRLDVLGAAGAFTAGTIRCSDSNMARLTLSNTNRSWTISNYGTQFNPNGALAIADETAAAVRAIFDTSGNFQFNSGYGSVATAYGCRAWVNFNGTGTVAIRASGNVSSITDNNTGDYTVNFTTAMPDANYSYVGCGSIRDATSNNVMITVGGDRDVAPTTSALRINTIYNNSGANTSIDSGEVCVSVFR